MLLSTAILVFTSRPPHVNAGLARLVASMPGASLAATRPPPHIQRRLHVHTLTRRKMPAYVHPTSHSSQRLCRLSSVRASLTATQARRPIHGRQRQEPVRGTRRERLYGEGNRDAAEQAQSTAWARVHFAETGQWRRQGGVFGGE